MHRVKTIETIFGYASLYKSPCFIIQILKHASHYSTNYTIVHHQNKYAKNCIPLLYGKNLSYPL